MSPWSPWPTKVRLEPVAMTRSLSQRSLDLLRHAQTFHEPTRAFYFVRAECRRRRGDTAAADEDVKRFKAAEAQSAWDYFLPGHTAGWRGDLDEAIRSYHAALRLQPNHYNSLFFLATASTRTRSTAGPRPSPTSPRASPSGLMTGGL